MDVDIVVLCGHYVCIYDMYVYTRDVREERGERGERDSREDGGSWGEVERL